MSTSEEEGLVIHAPGDADVDEPVDTVHMRAVINNALHLADEAGQHRAGWTRLNPSLVATGDIRLHDPLGTLVEDQWYVFAGPRILCAPKVRADGSGYRLRIWLAGYSDGGDSVDFGAMVVPAFDGLELAVGWDFAWPMKATSAITSTSAADLMPFDDATHFLDVPPEVIAAAIATAAGSWSTLDDLGGVRTSVPIPALEVIALGRTSDVGSEPVLTGFHAAEYIGP